MLGARDIFWAVVVCALLNLGWYYRPMWSARQFLDEQGQEGFVAAYAGHRYLDGQLVKGSGVANPLYTPIMRHRFNIRADHVSWNGKQAEFVVRHIVVLVDGTPAGEEFSQDLHVKLQRAGNRWQYKYFEVRDHGPMALSAGANPFAAALKLTGGPGS